MAEEKKQLEAPEDPANEQPLVQHLIELRNRIVRSAIAILVVFACMSPFMKEIFDYLSRPLMVALPQGVKLLATGVVAPFMVPLKVTLFAAFVVALPYVLYQIWAYIAPALYRREKKLVLPVIVSCVVMFALGMTYCYFIVFGMVFRFIASFSPESVNFAPDIDSYFSFVLTMFFAFGVTFEVPILVTVLNRVGIASREKLVKVRPFVIVGAFVLAAIFTPPDVLSQLLLAVPLVILYEVGLIVVKIFGRDTPPEELEDEEE
jgi:sec-independent protein translocase protein TatC